MSACPPVYRRCDVGANGCDLRRRVRLRWRPCCPGRDSRQAKEAFVLRSVAITLVALTAMLGAGADNADKTVSLFDGKTLAGWQGDAKFWRVEEGQIVA